MATVSLQAPLTVETGWDVQPVRTRTIDAPLTATALLSTDVVARVDADLTVTATPTAAFQVTHTISADLAVTSTGAGDFTATLVAAAPLMVFASPTAVVNSLGFTPAPERTKHVLAEIRTVVVTTPRRSTAPRPIKFTKDPDAVLDYTLDWSTWLAGTDTIISAVFTPESGITVNSSAFTDTTSTVRLSAGSDGTLYPVGVHVTTAGGRQDDRVMHILVQDQVPQFRFTKDPHAVLDYTLDWSRWLPLGDTITSVVFTPDSGITVDSQLSTATTTTVWLSAGEDGVPYEVRVHVTTAGGLQDDRVMLVSVGQ